MNPRSSLTRLAILLVLLLLAAACGSGSGTTSGAGAGGDAGTAEPGTDSSEDVAAEGPAEPVGSMVVGTGIDAAYASVVVAVREGFLERQGVDAELRVFASGQESLEATLTGESDFSGNGQYNVPFVAAQGGNVKIIAEYERSDEQFGAVAAQGIDSPEDLVGKRVATQFGTSPDYYFRLYAEQYGLDIEDVEYVDLQFAQMIPALAAGDIDAFFAFEPLLTNATENVPGAQILHRSGQDDVMPLRVFSVVSERVYSDPDLAVAFLRGMIEAGEWTNENRDEAAALIADEFEIELEDAQRYVGYFDYSVEFSEESLAELERVAEYVAERGLVDQPPDLSEFVDASFYEQATE